MTETPTYREVATELAQYFAYLWEREAACKLCGALVPTKQDHVFLLVHLKWHRHLDNPHASYDQVPMNPILNDLIRDSRERLRSLGL